MLHGERCRTIQQKLFEYGTSILLEFYHEKRVLRMPSLTRYLLSSVVSFFQPENRGKKASQLKITTSKMTPTLGTMGMKQYELHEQIPTIYSKTIIQMEPAFSTPQKHASNYLLVFRFVSCRAFWLSLAREWFSNFFPAIPECWKKIFLFAECARKEWFISIIWSLAFFPGRFALSFAMPVSLTLTVSLPHTLIMCFSAFSAVDSQKSMYRG